MPKDLHLDMELLKKIVPTILDLTNANRMKKKIFFQDSTKNKMAILNLCHGKRLQA